MTIRFPFMKGSKSVSNSKMESKKCSTPLSDRPTFAQKLVWRIARFIRRKPKRKRSPELSLPPAPPFSTYTTPSISSSLSVKSRPNSAGIGPSDYRVLQEFYILKQTIGEGSFGKVKKAIHRSTREPVAVKIIKKAIVGDEILRVRREISALKVLDHPYISKLYQIIETDVCIFIIMEFCGGGDLYDFIIRKKRIREDKAQKIFRQLVLAVRYVHEKGISHRDLKPENVLLDQRGDIRLIDFNLSNSFSSRYFETHCGTIEYAAPELLNGHRYDGMKSDAWSLGAVLYVILVGSYPFQEPGMREKIRRADYRRPKFISKDCGNLMNQLLVVEAYKRPVLEDLLHHPWLNPKPKGTEKVSPKMASALLGDDGDELDTEILTLMSGRLNTPIDFLRDIVSKPKFDSNDLATYRILVRKKQSLGHLEFDKFSSEWTPGDVNLKLSSATTTILNPLIPLSDLPAI